MCGSETGEVLWEFTRKEVVLLQGEREFSQVCSLEPNIPCRGSAETPQDWQASACVADAFGVFGAILFPMSRSGKARYGHFGEGTCTWMGEAHKLLPSQFKETSCFPRPLFSKWRMHLFHIFGWIKDKTLPRFINAFYFLLSFFLVKCLISTFCLQINNRLLEMY